jgi:hypothetical protein
LWLRSLSKEVRVVSTEKNPEGVAECLFELSTEKPKPAAVNQAQDPE